MSWNKYGQLSELCTLKLRKSWKNVKDPVEVVVVPPRNQRRDRAGVYTAAPQACSDGQHLVELVAAPGCLLKNRVIRSDDDARLRHSAAVLYLQHERGIRTAYPGDERRVRFPQRARCSLRASPSGLKLEDPYARQLTIGGPNVRCELTRNEP
jgi:hypothetical protein